MKGLVRLIIETIVELFSQVSRLFLIQNNRIFFLANRNPRRYVDSPMVISEYLNAKFKGEYELVWVFDNPKDYQYLNEKGVIPVRSRSFAELYYANTSRVFVSNMFGPLPYLVKRKDRLIIETTHGTAYKSLISGRTKTSKKTYFDRARAKKRINRATLCLSGNRITSEIVYKNELGYRGEIAEIGLPRNDIFFKDNKQIKDRIKNEFGINRDTKIILIMPTWKKNNNRKCIEIDYEKLISILENKDGNQWVVFLRLHHLTTIDISDILEKYKGLVFDATKYNDPQSLLCAGDMLITDYSSVVWDFAIQKKPIVLYLPDLQDYNDDTGFNVPPNEWRLFSAQEENQLYSLVENTTFDDLIAASVDHYELFGSYEKGNATETICRRIVDFCSKFS